MHAGKGHVPSYAYVHTRIHAGFRSPPSEESRQRGGRGRELESVRSKLSINAQIVEIRYVLRPEPAVDKFGRALPGVDEHEQRIVFLSTAYVRASTNFVRKRARNSPDFSDSVFIVTAMTAGQEGEGTWPNETNMHAVALASEETEVFHELCEAIRGDAVVVQEDSCIFIGVVD
eukprot:6198903-Pleurochrysis_carterae.AAC.2